MGRRRCRGHPSLYRWSPRPGLPAEDIMVAIVSVGAPPTERELPRHADRAQSPRAWRPHGDGRLLPAYLGTRDPQVGAGGRAQDQHSVPVGRGALSRHPAPRLPLRQPRRSRRDLGEHQVGDCEREFGSACASGPARARVRRGPRTAAGHGVDPTPCLAARRHRRMRTATIGYRRHTRRRQGGSTQCHLQHR